MKRNKNMSLRLAPLKQAVNAERTACVSKPTRHTFCSVRLCMRCAALEHRAFHVFRRAVCRQRHIRTPRWILCEIQMRTAWRSPVERHACATSHADDACVSFRIWITHTCTLTDFRLFFGHRKQFRIRPRAGEIAHFPRQWFDSDTHTHNWCAKSEATQSMVITRDNLNWNWESKSTLLAWKAITCAKKPASNEKLWRRRACFSRLPVQ